MSNENSTCFVNEANPNPNPNTNVTADVSVAAASNNSDAKQKQFRRNTNKIRIRIIKKYLFSNGRLRNRKMKLIQNEASAVPVPVPAPVPLPNDNFSDNETTSDNESCQICDDFSDTFQKKFKEIDPNINLLSHFEDEKLKLKECFRLSLFDSVPPFIYFHLEETNTVIPKCLQNAFVWKHSKTTPIVVRKILRNSGFEIIQDTNSWLGQWGSHMKSVNFRDLKRTQKLNHLPGSFQIGRKDSLWRNINKLSEQFGLNDFGFLPKTYILPKDIANLFRDWNSQKGQWIIKPPAGARGTGIKVISKWCQLPKKKPLIVQKYILNPFLINDYKFDLRIYVLVTSVNPLRIFLYKDGLVRFASVKYSTNKSDLSNIFIHLTNYSINKESKTFEKNNVVDSCNGHKWTLKSLWKYLENQNINTNKLWTQIKDCIIKTLISSENHMSLLMSENLRSRYSSYELFGFDFIIDENFKLWLLEVNISPSLHTNSVLDSHVKGQMVCDVLNIAQYHLPKHLKQRPELYSFYLLANEQEKHEQFEKMLTRENYLENILINLTDDDLNHLRQAEDELMIDGDFERIFPTHATHVYHKFMTVRYYNRLFDAWETKYSENREKALRRLESFRSNSICLS